MKPTFALAAMISLGFLLAGEAHAASLEISPVIVTLAPGQTAAVIQVQNRGGTPAAVQARAYAWTQSGDEDILTPTQSIILSPPIFTVPVGASQTLRLLLRGGPGEGGERSYRLLLDEVPAAGGQTNEIVIALRISMPVIAAGAPSARERLQWRAERGAGGEAVLTVMNTGRSYDKVSAIGVTLPDGARRSVAPSGKNPYILPGAQRQWIVQGGEVPHGTLQLSATTQAGKSEETLALAP